MHYGPYPTSYFRIMIFGRPGSGKSTFAFRLHRHTGLPLHHLDRYFFVENWVEQDYQLFLKKQQNIVDQDKWIIDGNNTKSLAMRYSKANLCIYFNYPRALCYWRILKRLFSKDKRIEDRAEGCSETVQWSLLSYMWTFEERVQQQIKELRRLYPQVRFVEIRNDKELQKLESKKDLFNLSWPNIQDHSL